MLEGETILSGAPNRKQDSHVSLFKVLFSGGGFFVGTTFTSCDDLDCCSYPGLVEPNTRETDYFRTSGAAKEALEAFLKTGEMTRQRK